MALDREFASVVELEVRKLAYAFEAVKIDLVNEDGAAEVLAMMHCYARDSGPRVKNECLSAIYSSCNWLRRRAATEVLVNWQTTIVYEALPIRGGGLLAPGRPLIKAERDLVSHATNVAGEICYDVCKYVRSEKVAKPAAELLGDILRFVSLNKLEDEKAEVLEEFDQCTRISGAQLLKGPFNAGSRLLQECKMWALDYSAR